MAIVFPLTVPFEEFAEVDVQDVNIATIQQTTFTGKDRLQAFDGDYWRLSMSYRNLPKDIARPVTGFIHSLRNSVGTFVVSFPGYDFPLGAAKDNPATPLVNGDGQAGSRELVVKNAPESIDDWLLPGDIIQVGPDDRPHWHTVLNSTSTNSSGQATVDIWPSLRNTTVNNDPIVTDFPKGLCRLTEAPQISVRRPVLVSLSLSAREVVP